MSTQTIGFVGAGQMARALAAGFVAGHVAQGKQIRASDPVPAALEGFAASVPGASTSQDNAEAACCDVVFLAVKPQQLPGVLADIKSHVTPKQLVISIAAGVTLDALSAGLADSVRIVRVMPNTPCLSGEGACAFALGTNATAEDALLVEAMLSSAGIAIQVEEKHLDAVTGLSGSGPAYVFLMIEALADGGVAAGLPRETAMKLAAQTVKGAAAMTLDASEHPGQLKDRVASPAGTTIAGLHVLEERGVRAALMAAVKAASQRSQELGK